MNFNKKETGGIMTFDAIVTMVREKFQSADVSSIEGKLAIQINLTGDPSGTFYVEVKDNNLSVEPYEYIDRDVMLTLSSPDFLKLIDNKLDPVLAFTLGKLKVDGDVGKALEIKKFF